MKKAVIFCSGELGGDTLWNPAERQDWLVVCADGGFRHAQNLGVTPDMIIGDGDSFLQAYPDTVPHQNYPPEKDVTDTQLCLDWVIAQGVKEVLILGGIGGRLDHEFSHFALILHGLKHGVQVRLLNAGNEIFMADKPFVLQPNGKKYVSFFPYGGAVTGFTVQGLKYQAENMTLSCDKVQASSNEFAENQNGEVFFTGGYLLVMLCNEA